MKLSITAVEERKKEIRAKLGVNIGVDPDGTCHFYPDDNTGGPLKLPLEKIEELVKIVKGAVEAVAEKIVVEPPKETPPPHRGSRPKSN